MICILRTDVKKDQTEDGRGRVRESGRLRSVVNGNIIHDQVVRKRCGGRRRQQIMKTMTEERTSTRRGRSKGKLWFAHVHVRLVCLLCQDTSST
jgi:hypothetical protein